MSLDSFYVHNQPKVNHRLVVHSGVSICKYDPLFLVILGYPKMVILGKKEILARVNLWNKILQDVVEVEGRTCSPPLML